MILILTHLYQFINENSWTGRHNSMIDIFSNISLDLLWFYISGSKWKSKFNKGLMVILFLIFTFAWGIFRILPFTDFLFCTNHQQLLFYQQECFCKYFLWMFFWSDWFANPLYSVDVLMCFQWSGFYLVFHVY